MLRTGRFLGLSLIALLLACGSSPKKVESVTAAVTPDRFADPTPRSRDANDVARFLAGLPCTEGSPFCEWEELEAWQAHRRELDRAWEGIERGSMPAMRAFQQRELSGKAIENAPAFYPFSGPDALMLTTFFPHNPTYVMVGLEPAGTLPTPKRYKHKDLRVSLARERATVASELRSSFFITRQMDHQFRGQVTDGLFLPIIHLLVRTRHTLLGYRYVRLDDAGRLIERPLSYRAPGRIGNKGVEIDFRTDADQSIHKLIYLSVNLSDERLRENQPFLTFVSHLPGPVCYFKATSYMTHKPEFSIIRDQVLSHSAAVLQDDTGIPYHFFNGPNWQVQLYGSYNRPYGSFKWLVQPDLKSAYATTAPKPLGFRIGYGYSKIESNLLLAKRK